MLFYPRTGLWSLAKTTRGRFSETTLAPGGRRPKETLLEFRVLKVLRAQMEFWPKEAQGSLRELYAQKGKGRA
jgi:hypothetical protein